MIVIPAVRRGLLRLLLRDRRRLGLQSVVQVLLVSMKLGELATLGIGRLHLWSRRCGTECGLLRTSSYLTLRGA